MTRDVGPYRAGRLWAEPSISHAAEMLRLVFEGGADVAARAEAARATIASQYSVKAVGRAVRDRLEVLAARSAVQREAAPNGSATAAPNGPAAAAPNGPATAAPNGPVRRPGAPNGPATAAPAPSSAYDLRLVLPPLDLDTSQHGLFGRWGKRAAGLLVRYHNFHQQRVNGILAGAIGDLASLLATLSERLDKSSAESREGLDRARTVAASVGARTRELARSIEVLETSLPLRLGETSARLDRLISTAERTDGRLDSVAESVRALGGRLEEELTRAVAPIERLEQGLESATGRLDVIATSVESAQRQSAAAAEAISATQNAMAAARREQDAATISTRAQIDAASGALSALESRLVELQHAASARHEEVATTLRDLQSATEALRVGDERRRSAARGRQSARRRSGGAHRARRLPVRGATLHGRRPVRGDGRPR